MRNHSVAKECGREQEPGAGQVVTGCLSNTGAQSAKGQRGTETHNLLWKNILEDGRLGKRCAHLHLQPHQNYRATIIENPKSSCAEVLQLRMYKRSQVQTSRRGRNTEWAGPTLTVWQSRNGRDISTVNVPSFYLDKEKVPFLHQAP